MTLYGVSANEQLDAWVCSMGRVNPRRGCERRRTNALTDYLQGILTRTKIRRQAKKICLNELDK